VLRGRDLATVRDQLGREPTVPFTVVARCAPGHPLVIGNATRDADGTPFPTTFWLTCPDAVRAVARLESAGGIRESNERYEADPVFRAAVDAAHAEAAAERDRLEPGAGGWGGVAGTRRGVKCLHAHYANHLAGGDDVIGRWVARQVEPIHPDAPDRPVAAAIDQGTNSTRLLVLAAGDPPVELARDLVITRLGQGVDASGRLHEDALARVDATITRYARRARALGASRIVVGATSAVRDAANRDAFVDLVARATGAPATIIDGEREAALSFAGAVGALDLEPGPVVVMDIGGGSTEFVVGDVAGRVTDAVSVQLGSVRMTERHLHDDPPTAMQLAELRDAVAAVLATVRVPVADARTFVAVAGTAVTVQALALGLDRDDPDVIHGSSLTVDDAAAVADRLARMPRAARDALPAMPPGRGEVIVAGAVILHEAMRRWGRDRALIAETDILDGLGFEALGVR